MSKKDKYGLFIVLIIFGIAVVGYVGNQWFQDWQYVRSFSEQTWQIDGTHTIHYNVPPDLSVKSIDDSQGVFWENGPVAIEMMRLTALPTEMISGSTLKEKLDNKLAASFSSFKNYSIIEPLEDTTIDEYQAATATVRAELFVAEDEIVSELVEAGGLPSPVFLNDYELALVDYDGLLILIVVEYRSGTPEINPEQYSLLKSMQESIYFGEN